MSQLSALLSVKDGVAVYGTLKQKAEAAIAEGDARTVGQLMADTLVDLVLGEPTTTTEDGVGVMINLVITDQTLLAVVVSRGGSRATDLSPPTSPENSPPRAGMATPPLHRTDHRRAGRDGLPGPPLPDQARPVPAPPRPTLPHPLVRRTDPTLRPHRSRRRRRRNHATNGQGLCEACNYNKQAIGWRAKPRPGPGHSVDTLTPTGHTYTSTAPALTAPSSVEVEAGRWTLIA